jgi:hypothetical protein
MIFRGGGVEFIHLQDLNTSGLITTELLGGMIRICFLGK